MKSSISGSRKDLWNVFYSNYKGERQIYCDDSTVRKGAAFLNVPDVKVIEDWGCGYGGLKNYIGSTQKYIGIDGSASPFADEIVDLEEYTSKVDAIFMRHVLEHNPNWGKILKNVMASFEKRMVLILFTPFLEITRIINEYPYWGNTNISMVDIAFKKEDITQYFVGVNWSCEENLCTNTEYRIEHIFYLNK
jgi:hypothetical protein